MILITLHVDHQVLNDAQLINVAGEVDTATAGQLREHLSAAVTDQPSTVVVDLAGVSFLDSTGLGVLVGALKRSRAAGGQLRLAGVTPAVSRVLRITGLSTAFHIYPDREGALKG